MVARPLPRFADVTVRSSGLSLQIELLPTADMPSTNYAAFAGFEKFDQYSYLLVC